MDNMTSLLLFAVNNLAKSWNVEHTPAIVRMLLDAGEWQCCLSAACVGAAHVVMPNMLGLG